MCSPALLSNEKRTHRGATLVSLYRPYHHGEPGKVVLTLMPLGAEHGGIQDVGTWRQEVNCNIYRTRDDKAVSSWQPLALRANFITLMYLEYIGRCMLRMVHFWRHLELRVIVSTINDELKVWIHRSPG